MGSLIVAGSQTPDPTLTGPRWNRTTEGRHLICRYLRRGTKGQCTAEAVTTEDDDVILCAKHLGAAANIYAAIVAASLANLETT